MFNILKGLFVLKFVFASAKEDPVVLNNERIGNKETSNTNFVPVKREQSSSHTETRKHTSWSTIEKKTIEIKNGERKSTMSEHIEKDSLSSGPKGTFKTHSLEKECWDVSGDKGIKPELGKRMSYDEFFNRTSHDEFQNFRDCNHIGKMEEKDVLVKNSQAQAHQTEIKDPGKYDDHRKTSVKEEFEKNWRSVSESKDIWDSTIQKGRSDFAPLLSRPPLNLSRMVNLQTRFDLDEYNNEKERVGREGSTINAEEMAHQRELLRTEKRNNNTKSFQTDGEMANEKNATSQETESGFHVSDNMEPGIERDDPVVTTEKIIIVRTPLQSSESSKEKRNSQTSEPTVYSERITETRNTSNLTESNNTRQNSHSDGQAKNVAGIVHPIRTENFDQRNSEDTDQLARTRFEELEKEISSIKLSKATMPTSMFSTNYSQNTYHHFNDAIDKQPTSNCRKKDISVGETKAASEKPIYENNNDILVESRAQILSHEVDNEQAISSDYSLTQDELKIVTLKVEIQKQIKKIIDLYDAKLGSFEPDDDVFLENISACLKDILFSISSKAAFLLQKTKTQKELEDLHCCVVFCVDTTENMTNEMSFFFELLLAYWKSLLVDDRLLKIQFKNLTNSVQVSGENSPEDGLSDYSKTSKVIIRLLTAVKNTFEQERLLLTHDIDDFKTPLLFLENTYKELLKYYENLNLLLEVKKIKSSLIDEYFSELGEFFSTLKCYRRTLQRLTTNVERFQDFSEFAISRTEKMKKKVVNT